MRKSQTTKKQVIFTIYSSQISSSVTRGHSPPPYDKYWLYYWCMENTLFHTLYDNWVLSGFKTDLKPSVDRIIEKEPYTKDNLQLMSFSDNRAKGHSAVVGGDLIRRIRPINQYTASGEFIRSFPSLAAASRLLSIGRHSISSVLKKSKYRHTAGGFIFKYVNYDG